MSHFPTFTKRAILNLTALTVALALLVSTACSSNGANPTSPPDRGEQTLEEKIDQLNSEIASLRREAEEPRSTERQESAQRVGQTEPATSQPARTPEVTITGQAATQPGICGRSP